MYLRSRVREFEDWVHRKKYLLKATQLLVLVLRKFRFQPTMHDVNQGVCNTLVVPITIISNAEPQSLQNHLSGPVEFQNETLKELCKQGESVSGTFCKESYSQPEMKMPHHPSVK